MFSLKKKKEREKTCVSVKHNLLTCTLYFECAADSQQDLKKFAYAKMVHLKIII